MVFQGWFPYLCRPCDDEISLGPNARLSSLDSLLASLAGGNAVHYVCDEKINWYPDIDDIQIKIIKY